MKGRDTLREAWTLLRMIRLTGRGRFASTLAMMTLGSLSEGLSLVMLVPMLHLLSRGGGALTVPLPASWGGSFDVGLGTVLIGFVLLVALRAAVSCARDILTADMLFRFINRLRLETFAAIARARWEHLLERRVSDLNHALTADMDRVQGAAMQLLMLVQSAVLLSAYLAVSLFLSKLVTLVAAVVGVAALFLLTPIRRRAARFGETLTLNRQAQHGVVGEFLGGLRVARSLNGEARYIERLNRILKEARANAIDFLRVRSTGTASLQLMSAIMATGYIYLAVQVVKVPFANTLALVVLLVRVVPPIMALQMTMQDVITNLHAFTTIRHMRDDCHAARERSDEDGDGDEDGDEGTGLPPPATSGTIAFRDVSYHYPSAQRRVLDGASFDIRANRITTLVGPSGSGKSTIADLLLRLLEPHAGTIAIGDTPLSGIDRKAWRARVAYVQQETFLAHATLAENMRLACEDADEAEIWQALADADAAQFVRRLTDGLETLVGERGTRFSGGERQRLALARALLRRPHLLILDEATSSLDWHSRRQVTDTISALRGRMTILAIDHGYAMAVIADDIVVLADGRVQEAGPAAALLRTSSYLRAMRGVEAAGDGLQSGGGILPADGWPSR